MLLTVLCIDNVVNLATDNKGIWRPAFSDSFREVNCAGLTDFYFKNSSAKSKIIMMPSCDIKSVLETCSWRKSRFGTVCLRILRLEKGIAEAAVKPPCILLPPKLKHVYLYKQRVFQSSLGAFHWQHTAFYACKWNLFQDWKFVKFKGLCFILIVLRKSLATYIIYLRQA